MLCSQKHTWGLDAAAADCQSSCQGYPRAACALGGCSPFQDVSLEIFITKSVQLHLVARCCVSGLPIELPGLLQSCLRPRGLLSTPLPCPLWPLPLCAGDCVGSLLGLGGEAFAGFGALQRDWSASLLKKCRLQALCFAEPAVWDAQA